MQIGIQPVLLRNKRSNRLYRNLSLSGKAIGPGGTNGRDKVLYLVNNNFEVNVYRGIYLP
jgi:hypothetical protein